MLIDLAAFREREAQGLISARSHPTHDLIIWNYTTQCQYQRAWDEVTMQARGLITRADGTILAKSFPKFFNYGEREIELPLEPFKVTEKQDGSLGVSY
ncbi:MAG TPA: RNA ligase, partial [Ktedonosporobacter sp.]|nr:RNA ligase [Ktedonosporobacter sp.]